MLKKGRDKLSKFNIMSKIKKKVDWAVKILGLEEYRKRKPKNIINNPE